MRLSVQKKKISIQILARSKPRWPSKELEVCLEGNLGLTRPCTKVVLFAQSAASLRGAAGFQRKMGLRAAPTSSRRRTRVVCGAVFTNSGFLAASAAMAFIASMKRSHSSLDSDSVVSNNIAPATIRAKPLVHGAKRDAAILFARSMWVG